MPSFPSPIPAPIFDSDESDEASQQSNDSSSYLSSQFNQYTRLSYSPNLTFKSINFDESFSNHDDLTSPLNIRSNTNKKRKRHDELASFQTPHQSPQTRRKNLDYVQEITFQSPKNQRRTRHHDQTLSYPFTDHININPFSSENVHSIKHRYPTRSTTNSSKHSFSQILIQRYEQEFHQQYHLGSGQFSHVYLCTNRLDGLNYALKTSKQSILGTNYEQIAWREICAYSILKSHENLVRYYSSWIENDGRFYLQLEYCNQGSLEESIEKNNRRNEFELKTLLHQMSDVLDFLHRNNFAHMDIKPSNIMICQYTNEDIIYKLTDLGHINQIDCCHMIDEDGDSRYLALEAIEKSSKNFIDLDKCDIFSLGLTIYVCGTNYHLPKQGNEWRQLRLNIRKTLLTIEQCSKEFNDFLFESMCHLNPKQRLTAYDILTHSIIQPIHLTSRQALQFNLKQEREKNLVLNKKLLDQYIDLQILPNEQTIHSPIQSNTFVSQQQIFSTPTDHSRIVYIHTPITPNRSTNQSILSPQQVKLAGSNMFRYYSSII